MGACFGWIIDLCVSETDHEFKRVTGRCGTCESPIGLKGGIDPKTSPERMNLNPDEQTKKKKSPKKSPRNKIFKEN